MTMYCYHCGKEIDESKVKASNSFVEEEVPEDFKMSYVCPQCGHLIAAGAGEEDLKSLSRAAHAQLQRARNRFAVGMGNLSIGIIAGVISFLFFLLAKKPSNQYQLVVTCAEFYVFIILGVVALGMLTYGGISVAQGILKKKKYDALLTDLKNETFVQ